MCEFDSWDKTALTKKGVVVSDYPLVLNTFVSQLLGQQLGALERHTNSGEQMSPPKSLDLRFLIHHVFTNDRVEFLHFDLVGRCTLVLGGRVVVTGARGRDEFNLVAHLEILLSKESDFGASST